MDYACQVVEACTGFTIGRGTFGWNGSSIPCLDNIFLIDYGLRLASWHYSRGSGFDFRSDVIR